MSRRGENATEPSLVRRWSRRTAYTLGGAALSAVGLAAFMAPFAVGTWSLQFLALPMFAVGLADIYATAANPELRTRPGSYATGFLAIAAGLLLYLSPSLVATGVVAALLLLLAIDGLLKTGQSLLGRATAAPRTVTAINGVSNLLVAAGGWWLWQRLGIETAIGFAIAGYTIAAGWRMMVAPPPSPEGPIGSEARDVHPYARLRLGANPMFRAANEAHVASAAAVRQNEVYWLVVVCFVLFATHLGRMQSADSWLGMVSPVVATGGDFIMAVLLGGLLLLPMRLLWRRLTAPFERRAWQLRFAGEDGKMRPVPRYLLIKWTEARYTFSGALRDARLSLPSAAAVVLRLGLPLSALFVAINTIWGFTWYFNTESWASAFYQKVTELRIDDWRAAMVDRVTAVYGESDDLFNVSPAGIEEGDFAFLVVGDPGEGDPSQYALTDRYLEIGRREDVKFLVIASDVIYPAGAMSDYERNFYLPFKGFSKPIYAIPGNHDWFDALEGFNANFLEPQAARAALEARVDADLHLTSTTAARIERYVDQARRLRELYGADVALQRGPFFEIQTPDFAMIAIDTGIGRTVDERQRAWIAAALERSRGKFVMALLGHPKFAGGSDTSTGDADFAALYDDLEKAGADVLMAGDTHAFEYYVDYAGDEAGSRRPVYHFVNGGGGAYLSIGGALGWPADLPTETWAFYPGSEALRGKLDAETPTWKWPVWAWIRRFGAWPVSIETLSGIFDFNHAPFFQSFMEVRVERSRHRVVLALHGVNGPVRWRDLDASFEGLLGAGPDDPVEFVARMRAPTPISTGAAPGSSRRSP